MKRGSFLRRSEKDLSAIASLTKSVLPVQAQRSGTNFVFASITPERPTNNRKQKKDEQKQDEVIIYVGSMCDHLTSTFQFVHLNITNLFFYIYL